MSCATMMRAAMLAIGFALCGADAAGAQQAPANPGAWHPAQPTFNPYDYAARGTGGADCATVQRSEIDRFGDSVQVQALMCDDGQGNLYVPPQSRREVHDW